MTACTIIKLSVRPAGLPLACSSPSILKNHGWLTKIMVLTDVPITALLQYLVM